MLAYHPITGKEIRVIQTDASLWKENKTLCFTKIPVRVWDTISTEFNLKTPPDFYIMLEPVSDYHLKLIASNVKLLLLSKNALGSRSLEDFKNLRLGNVLGLEELSSMYPHLGEVWDGTVEDAVVMLAALLRYHRISGVWNERAERVGLKKAEETPERIWWVTQYYTPPNAKRRRELRTCLQRNIESPFIDRILLLNEKEEDLPKSEKVEERILGKRLTYADVLSAAESFPTDVILVFANADICIDDSSWKQLWDVNLNDKFIALLRYDVPESGKVEESKLFGPRADSQDTWVLRVADIVKRGAHAMSKNLDFQFGRMGCDNAIALEMLRQKFMVVNPALSLKTWHFHSSAIRTYEQTDVVERPMFHYIHPSGFHDLQPVFKFETIVQSVKPSSLPRTIRGPAANKWIVAANRGLSVEETPLKLNNTNTRTPVIEPMIQLKNCFQTPEGLVYTKDKLLIGPSKRAQEVWSSAQVSSMTPTLECKKGLIVPWPSEASKNRESYVLQYLSKIFRLASLQTIVKEGYEFFCPENKGILDALEAFDWRTPKLPVLKHEPDVAIWCHEALAFPVTENTMILSEDVEALRRNIPQWVEKVKPQNRMRIVILEDGKVLTSEIVRGLEDVLERVFDIRVVYPGKTSASRMLDSLCGAWGVIGCSGMEAMGWNWVLPKQSYVFEVIGGGSGDRNGLDISSASGLEHRFVEIGGEVGLDSVLEAVLEEEKSWSVETSGDETRPLIWIPRKDLEGYFGHPGDSFREMVRLWAQAGLCRVKEHPSATMVWWGEVGAKGVLLYDRPNHDWRLAAPLVEKSWAFALFGNPKPPAAGGAVSPWFFWPRRPELVETLPRDAPWEERKEGIVFYGKTENKVQEKRRTVEDWKIACCEWSMVKGDETYPFTQKEYLEQLSKSRFGLCLAGYGYKCHREVECMAMGCVPVCAPEVDMDSYAVPPVEGVHYIRVQNPEDALAKIQAISKERWDEMSEAGKRWWRETCSVAGSFALTKRLIENQGGLGKTE